MRGRIRSACVARADRLRSPIADSPSAAGRDRRTGERSRRTCRSPPLRAQCYTLETMGARLAGGCSVGTLRDGEPYAAGTLRAWSVIGRATGAQHVSLRTLEFAPGTSPALRSEADDVWYVVEGMARLDLDGDIHDVGPGAGIYIRPGHGVRVHNAATAPLVVASVRGPEPADPATLAAPPQRRPAAAAAAAPPIVRLRDRPRTSTGDRWYVELVNDSVGSHQMTQFVGSIPPGRAPDHYHRYEEVIVILAGRGTAWAGETRAGIATGACIYLPKKQ